MPTPSRTSIAQIVAAGRGILEAEGLDGLTMQRVAVAVGVRAPSLYKRVDDRAALVRLIAIDAEAELSRTLDTAATGDDPRRDLEAIATAFRAFARANPEAYALLFRPLPDAFRPEVDPASPGFAALFRTVEAIAGPDERLEAARTVVAWANGFVGMELSGAFRMGGDVDRAFAFGARHIADAISKPGRGARR
ncbi:MAG TPA: WHG domain-containing protein [Candidatus Limnocylindrales bacterium]|jgi:AcrR family transcriptional regulator